MNMYIVWLHWCDLIFRVIMTHPLIPQFASWSRIMSSLAKSILHDERGISVSGKPENKIFDEIKPFTYISVHQSF
jgi:hypothetical protein